MRGGGPYVGLKQYDVTIKDYHAAIELDKSNQELYKKGVKAGLKTGKNKNAMSVHQRDEDQRR